MKQAFVATKLPSPHPQCWEEYDHGLLSHGEFGESEIGSPLPKDKVWKQVDTVTAGATWEKEEGEQINVEEFLVEQGHEIPQESLGIPGLLQSTPDGASGWK